MTAEESEAIMAPRRAARFSEAEIKVLREQAMHLYYAVAINADLGMIVIYKPTTARNFDVMELIRRSNRAT